MTKQEAIKFLSNTKVYVNGKSKEVQKKLFSLGFQWQGQGKEVLHTRKPFIFIWKDKNICHCDDMEYFTNNKTFREITSNDILNIVIDEPKYRPFKNAEECWNEMLKHQPFGWVSLKNKNIMTFICYISNDSVQIHDGCTFHGWNFNYEEMFDKYIFSDGTPFGIKEEES